jgi:hypothetical protein
MISYILPASRPTGAIMPRPFVLAAALFIFAATTPVFAQNATATARLGGGQTATVNAVKEPDKVAYLDIALPKGPQRIDFIGDQLLPIKVSGRDSLLTVADLNGDGVDEIIVRGSISPETGSVLVFRWNAESGQFLPVIFTDDQNADKPFLFVAASSPVMLDKSGSIEIKVERVDQSGRKATILERYRWDGDGYRYAEDH